MNDVATILIVDDEQPVLNALERSLGLDGHNMIKTTSPKRALEIVGSQKVDLIISDHLMPEMKGLDLLREVNRLRPKIIRILLTGHADLELAMKAINEGEVYRFFQKPWDDENLRLDVRLALSHRKLETENVRLSNEVDKQAGIINRLEKDHPGIGSVERTSTGAIVIDDDELDVKHSKTGEIILDDKDF
ncbi:MAG: response regulator [Deltaproteobacteria bacterium]|nr:response regulator [Deltaproteobacteria bacterium]